ncbi:hypothetical protein Vretimale_18301 [Volvox reticuliferus]|nr:hypothetical protein Vretimale_18301 [Volvox reticuliferus]
MALIRPVVDLTRGTLNIHAPKDANLPPLELAIPRHFRRACHHPATLAVEAGPKPPGAVAAEVGSGGGASTRSETGLVAAAAAAETGARAKDYNAAVRHRDSVRLDAGLTLERVQVCGDTVCSDLADAYHGPEGDARIRKWFVRLLGVPCRVVQQRTGARKVRRPVGKGTKGPISSSSPSQGRSSSSTSSSSSSSQPAQQRQSKDSGNDEGTQAASGAGTNEEPSVGFANDGQYLLVSEASLSDLRMRLGFPTGVDTGGCSSGTGGSGSNAGGDGSDSREGDDLVARLRPNLVVSGFLPYEEDGWVGVRVGPLHANVLGTCPRCELLQVDPRVGVRRGAEVLVALAQYRRNGGRVQFGILLAAEPVTAGRMAQASSEIARLRAENGMAAALRRRRRRRHVLLRMLPQRTWWAGSVCEGSLKDYPSSLLGTGSFPVGQLVQHAGSLAEC